MLVDTVVGSINLDHDVDEQVFNNFAVSADRSTGQFMQRAWLSTREARVTWYGGSRTLRCEFSVGGSELVDARTVFEQVDDFLRKEIVVGLPPITRWRCQRVDYAANLAVAVVAPYIAALDSLMLAGMVRHRFGGTGVVWKSRGKRGQWVKFYDRKAKDGSATQPGTSMVQTEQAREEPRLRFEVSNYRDKVRYMAARWFPSPERTVQDMTHPGRALYALARVWTDLGLHTATFGAAEAQHEAYVAAFGVRNLASALHARQCISTYGTRAYSELGWMSKSSYYRWLKRLREAGLLVMSSEQAGLTSLLLPCETVFEELLKREQGKQGEVSQNLESRTQPLSTHTPLKTGPKNTAQNVEWSRCAAFLGVKPTAPPISWLNEVFHEWQSARIGWRSGILPRVGVDWPRERMGAIAVSAVGGGG